MRVLARDPALISVVCGEEHAAAMISYRHRNLDDSLARFQAILESQCKSADAVQAKEGLLAIYQARGENEKFQATADKFIKQQCADIPNQCSFYIQEGWSI